MPKSTATCNSVLALIFNATAWADIAQNDGSGPLTDLYLSLHTADPGVGNAQTTNETAYTNYVRIAVERTTSGWDAPASGATANAALAQFAQCGVTGATLTHAAIVTAGWQPEYHTVAKAVGSQVVITCPYITLIHTNYVEIRAASSNSATAVLFGSALNHYGKSRTSSGDWRSGSWLVGFTAAMNVGATARIKNPMLRRAVSAVR